MPKPTTLASNRPERVGAQEVCFRGNLLQILLNDDREVSLPTDEIPWLHWLARATPEQGANWSIEPGGYAVYWEDLDDGVEIEHALSVQ